MSKRKADAISGGINYLDDRKKSQKLSLSRETISSSEEESQTSVDNKISHTAKNVESLVSKIFYKDNETSESVGENDELNENKNDGGGVDTAGTKDGESGSDSCKEPKEVKPVIDVNQPRLTDILLVEHAVKNIQSSIDSIIQSAPDEEGLLQMQQSVTDETNPQLTSALVRYKMKLAAKLKTMYNNKELEIFDQILNFEQLTDALQAPKPIDFSSTPQFTPVPTSSSSNSSHFTNGSGSTISSFGSYDKDLPPLPEIKDPAIRARVFIHKSLIKDKLFLSKREQLHSHNERLEFLGDSVLNNMMTQIAYHRFPDAAEGMLSVLRTKLISNATLMRWSSAYGLDRELKKNTPAETLNNGKMKLYADVFEAYIGGLMTENPANYSVVYEWLKQLAEPILKKNEPRKEARSEFRPNAKMELYSLIGSASLGLHYDCVHRDTKSVPASFTVELRTGNGDLLGTGRAENIKIAGTKAAMEALDDKELIEKYSLIRANTPRDASKIPAHESGAKRPNVFSKAEVSSDSKDSNNYSNDDSNNKISNNGNNERPAERPSDFSRSIPDSNGRDRFEASKAPNPNHPSSYRSNEKSPANFNRPSSDPFYGNNKFNGPKGPKGLSAKGSRNEKSREYRESTYKSRSTTNDSYRSGGSTSSNRVSNNNSYDSSSKYNDRF